MAFNRFKSEPKQPSKASGGLAAYVEAEKLMHIAFVLPAAVAVGWALGWWADSRLHQSWIEIAGAVFGCVAGLAYMIRMAIDAQKDSSSGNADQNGTKKGSTGNP